MRQLVRSLPDATPMIALLSCTPSSMKLSFITSRSRSSLTVMKLTAAVSTVVATHSVTLRPSQALALALVRIEVRKFSAVVFSFHSHLWNSALAADTSIATVTSACPAEKITFSHRTLAALTTIETDAPASRRSVGLAVPRPSPMIVTPATSQVIADAPVSVSLCPAMT